MIKVGTQQTENAGKYTLLGLYITGSLGFLLLSLYQGTLTLELNIALAGLLIGLGSVIGNIYFVKALQVGPASLTAPVANINTIIVVLMSILVFGERLSLTEFLGILLTISGVMLLPIDPKETISIQSRLWYFFAFSAMGLFFLRNGGLKITQELDYDNTQVLLYGYSLGIFWFGSAIEREQEGFSVPYYARPWLAAGLLAGCFSFGGIQLYAYALSLGPASIVAPIFSVNGLVVGLLSMWYFKERLSPVQTLAMIAIIGGLILTQV